MKLGIKIFITTFILVIIFIFIIGTLIINNGYSITINNQISKSIFQINNIYNNFNLYDSNDALSMIANQYLKDNIYIKIYDDTTLIYNNINELNENLEKQLLEDSSKQIKTYIVNKMLYTSLIQDKITIITLTDISAIYESNQNQKTFF